MEWTKLENDSIPARFLLRLQILPRKLLHLPRIATTLPVNSVNVNSPAKKIMYHPWNLGGLNPYFFGILGGLAPPRPCVEPPLFLITFALFSIIDICKLLCVCVKGVILNEDLMMMMSLKTSYYAWCEAN